MPFSSGSVPAATADEPIIIPDDNDSTSGPVPGKKLKRKAKPFVLEEAEEEEVEEVALRAYSKRKGKGKARA
jgi:hypothetical protein